MTDFHPTTPVSKPTSPLSGLFLALLLAVGLVAACATTTVRGEAPPPLPQDRRGFEAAALVSLPERAPEHVLGLHNYYALSDNIVSGAEPENPDALRELADRGIRTIVSVDGATPDHETAANLGMRYVHIPIRYGGVERDEMMAIAKTFREQPGPFYVHCFHGKHRGPVAAAVGRMIVDGVDRATALAEMRQWCGTAEKYEGLYNAVAYENVPSVTETNTFAYDFPKARAFAGHRAAMVQMTREYDVLKALATRNWQPDPAHPDWDGRNAAAKLADILAQTRTMQETLDEDDQYQGWLASCERDAREIINLLNGDASASSESGEAPLLRAANLVDSIKSTCTRCHSGYRN